tara:strand:- start:296 stop:763 length:468 start_codon:yes stop_codon:yes gene_type:complete
MNKLQPIRLEVIDVPRWIHEYVYINYSKIPEADLGIFAKTNIEQGTFLGDYFGEICSTYINHVYIMSFENEKVIDASDILKSNYTRFMNCSTCYENENVLVIKMLNDHLYDNNTKNLKNRIFFYAKREIKKDEELLYYYGDIYAKHLNITYKLKN